MRKLARSLILLSAHSLAGTAAAAVLSLAYVSLAAHLLGPAAYGRVGATVSSANLFFLALNPLEAGITLRVARLAGAGRLAELRAYGDRALRGLAIIGLLGFAAWGAAILVFDPQRLFGSRWAAFWLGGFCAAAFIACAPRGGLRGREKFAALGVNIVLESAVRFAVGMGGLWLTGGAAALVLGYAAGMAVAIVHGQVLARAGLPVSSVPSGHWRDDLLLPLRSVSAPLLALNLYSVMAANVDVLAARYYLTESAAGHYAGAASLARLVPVAANPVLLVLFSRLAALKAAQVDLRATFLGGTALVVAGLGASLLVPWLGGRSLVSLLLGASFAEAQPLLLVQWATGCVLTLQVFLAESLLATSHLRGGWLFALPALSFLAALYLWHADGLQIAHVTLGICCLMGSAVCFVLWWFRADGPPLDATLTKC